MLYVTTLTATIITDSEMQYPLTLKNYTPVEPCIKKFTRFVFSAWTITIFKFRRLLLAPKGLKNQNQIPVTLQRYETLLEHDPLYHSSHNHILS